MSYKVQDSQVKMKGATVLLGLFLTVTALSFTEGSRPVWYPENCDRDTFFQFNGCNVTNWVTLKHKCQEIRRLMSEVLDLDPASQAAAATAPEASFGCIEDEILNEDQCDAVLDQLNNVLAEKDKRRKKRKILTDFKINRWTFPIPYKIDGILTDRSAEEIRSAIELWKSGTCLEFEELEVDQPYADSHILFTDTKQLVCYSYIGRTQALIPQPIYLSVLCYTKGVLAHEIGHALGLVHEHQRPDRDQYITINNDNVLNRAEALFSRFESRFVGTDLPYDYGSDMHYRSTAYSSNGEATIKTADPQYQRTIGQRVELSFWDFYAINMAYCSNICKNKLPRRCANRGYQDPKNCYKCRCPDGWGGDYCDAVASSSGPERCGGYRMVNGWYREDWSPSYFKEAENSHFYPEKQTCSWLIEAPAGKRVVLWFEGDFGVYCYNNRCLDWVEVRHKVDLGLTGYRYCCNERPEGKIVSETNRMMVIFKANNATSYYRDRRGFKVKYGADGDECSSRPCRNGGLCYDGVANYTCSCRGGYTGRNCETYISPPTPSSVSDIDLVFLLDTAERPRKDLYSTRSFVRRVIDRFSFGMDKTRVGVATFSDYAILESHLNSHRSLDGFLDALSAIRGTKGAANYYSALWLLYSDMYDLSHGDRLDVPNVALMVTDTAPDDTVVRALRGSMVSIGQTVRDNGIHLFIVGVGPQVDLLLLQEICGSKDNVLYVDSYQRLMDRSTIERVVSRIRLASVNDPGLEMKPSSTISTTTTTTTTPRPTTRPTTRRTTRRTTTTTTTTTTTPRPTTTRTTTTKRPTTRQTTTRKVVTKPNYTSTTSERTPKQSGPMAPPPPPGAPRPSSPSPANNRPTSHRIPTTRMAFISPKFKTPSPPTTKSTTTTTTTSTPPSDRQGCWWERTACSEDCGGCGDRRVRRMCSGPYGPRMHLQFYESCNSQICTETCWYYVAKLYEKPCRPMCCSGYKSVNFICVPDFGKR